MLELGNGDYNSNWCLTGYVTPSKWNTINLMFGMLRFNDPAYIIIKAANPFWQSGSDRGNKWIKIEFWTNSDDAVLSASLAINELLQWS